MCGFKDNANVKQEKEIKNNYTEAYFEENFAGLFLFLIVSNEFGSMFIGMFTLSLNSKQKKYVRKLDATLAKCR
jgi:hypothetical protein